MSEIKSSLATVINCKDLFNPDLPEATLEYVLKHEERAGTKLKHSVTVYEDEKGTIRIAASKASATAHLGLLEIGKKLIHDWNDGAESL